MRGLLGPLGLLLLVWAIPVESVDEDAPPVTSRFHCRRDGCCDQHEWCRFWASVGECKTNAEWMKDNCQISCNTCGKASTSPRRPSPIRSRPRQHRPTVPRRPAPAAVRRPPTHVAHRPPPPLTRRPTFHTFTRATARPAQTRAPVHPRPTVATHTRNSRIRVLHFKRPRHRIGLSHRLPPRPAPRPPLTTTTFATTTTTPTSTTTITTPATTTTTTTTTTPTTTTTAPTTTTTSTTTTTTTTPAPTTTTTTPLREIETTLSFTSTSGFNNVENFRPRFPTRTTPRRVFFRPPVTTRRPPPPRPATTTTTTTRRTTTTTTTTTTTRPFTTTPPPHDGPTTARTPPPRALNSNELRCQEIINDPIVSAEEMIRERLVVATEDNSRRQTVDLDMVIRSNQANACVPRLDETDCEANMCYNAYFRTFDGTCNNIQNPLRGASYRPYTRLLPTIYDNELSEPVGSLFPNLRPSPREITRTLTSSHASVVVDEYNALVMQFGQFISHDMAKTTLVPSAKCNVCQNITSRCMSVPVERDDPNSGFRQNGCVRVSRSSPICGSGNQKPRQQLNENTGYIDVSPIYGSSVHDSQKFRDGNTGFLKLPMFNGMQTLPFDQSRCRNRASCTVIFTAGDSRVNLFVGLSAYHTIFTREHNRIANTLQRLNPHWNGDRIFLEARKIVGAEVQAIVYREWLPKVLGAAFASVVGDYHGYDPTVDATVANEFTSAAFRFGHGMIQEVYQRLDPNFNNITFGALAFQKGTLHSDVLVNEGGPDPLIRGMFSQSVKRPQRITTTVTENMFGSTDLSSINIQRGRDHGHPAYVKYRELCGMGTATNFDHLSREILNTGTREKLQRVYGTVDRIDLWVGALLEDPVIRGLVGPTVACIVGPQFKRTRDGDRFYYENPGVFTRRQLAEIRKSSFSRIICDNTNTITMVPREAFRMGHLTPCNQIPQMDLSHWRE